MIFLRRNGFSLLIILQMFLDPIFPVLSISDEETTSTGSAHGRNQQQQDQRLELILRYDFTSENCSNQTFPNLVKSSQFSQLELDLDRDENKTSCSLGLGVESRVPSSSLSPTKLSARSYLDSSKSSRIRQNQKDFFESYKRSQQGISIELWLQPLGSDDDSVQLNQDLLYPILTFGFANSGNDDDPNNLVLSPRLTECDIQQIDLQIAQRGNSFEVIFRTSDVIFEPCTRYRLVDYPIRQGQINHIVVALSENRQQITINGEPSPILNEQFDESLQHWNANDIIYLFSHPKVADRRAVWDGRLYQLLVYDGFLTSPMILSNMAVNFPPSKPYAISRTITMNEDAEIVPGSHDARWYSKPRHYGDGEFPEISLQQGFIENDLLSFLDDIGLPRGPQRETYIFITRVPSKGSLYRSSDGAQLLNQSAIASAGDKGTLVYIPVHNDHSMLPGSVYTSFDYCVSENLYISSDDCDSATVYIVVNAVGDPPIPVAFPESVDVIEGTAVDNSKAIRLSGLDFDSMDSISSIQITDNPLYGYLILSVSTFRRDGLLHGTPITSLNNIVVGEAAFVEYVFDKTTQIVQTGIVTDSFRFRASDSTGLWSIEKLVSINVKPGVIGIPQTPVSILEDSIGLVKLRGKDISGLQRTIVYMLDTVPAETEGKLFDSTNVELKQDSIVRHTEEFPYVHGVTVAFWPLSDYCTNKSNSDSRLSYRVAALVDGKITSLSDSLVQGLHIECLPDPLNLTGPSTVYELEPFDGSHSGPCNGYFYNGTDVSPGLCKTAAIISGIHVSSRDSHALHAQVSISASCGVLTINRNYWDEILPLDGQVEVRKTIKFLALPKKLDDILSYLHFQSDVPGECDIEVVIHYPSGCSGNSTYCQVLSHAIPVVIKRPRRHSRKSYLFRGFQWIPLPFTILMLLLIKLKGSAREKLATVHWLDQNGPSDNNSQERQEIEDASREEDVIDQASTSLPVVTSTEASRPRWIRHCDESSGHYYYENALDGTVTWQAPSDGLLVEGNELREYRGREVDG